MAWLRFVFFVLGEYLCYRTSDGCGHVLFSVNVGVTKVI